MGLFDNTPVNFQSRRQIEKTDSSNAPVSVEPVPVTYDTYYRAYKQCPEFLAVVESLSTDIISDGGNLTCEEESQDKIKQMDKHLVKIDFEKKIKDWIRHGFLTGDGYLEFRKADKETVKSLVAELLNATCKQMNKSVSKSEINKAVNYYVSKREKNVIAAYPFNVYPMKTSGTSKIVDDNGEVIGLKQEVNNKQVLFTSKEIINWMPIDVNEIYGFTPAQAVTDDIATLLFAKQYAGKFFENGGVPNYIFILEKARGAQDRNYEVAKAEIKNSRNKSQWHKTMIMTGGGGSIKIEKLNDFKKDMEFMELINVCVRNIAMGFGVPPSKVPYKMESKGDLRELNEGYWKSINEYQNTIENLLNHLIFNEYGLKWRFNRTYKIDELREANIVSLLVDRGVINLKEAREKIGLFTVPKDLQLVTNRGNEAPHRDQGRKQDSRGTGEDKGEKVMPSYSSR